MAQLIKTDGTKTEVKPADEKHFTLDELQGFCGGNIDIVPMPSGRRLVVNDEGKLTGLPKNEIATQIWKEEYPIEEYPLNNDELIVGDVLLLEIGEEEDEE